MAVNLISSNDINITQSGSDISLDFTQNAVANKNIYSTSETRIGKWIDGKPLYRKVLTLETLNNNGETRANYDSSYLIKKFEIFVSSSSITFTLPLAGSNYINCFNEKQNHYISVQTSSDRTAFTDNYVIIEYTKTTD